jgi:hypothetical protein
MDTNPEDARTTAGDCPTARARSPFIVVDCVGLGIRGEHWLGSHFTTWHPWLHHRFRPLQSMYHSCWQSEPVESDRWRCCRRPFHKGWMFTKLMPATRGCQGRTETESCESMSRLVVIIRVPWHFVNNLILAFRRASLLCWRERPHLKIDQKSKIHQYVSPNIGYQVNDSTSHKGVHRKREHPKSPFIRITVRN